MGEVRNFIAGRLAELEPRAAQLEAELAPLRAEIADLKKAHAVLEGKPPRGPRRTCAPEPDTIQGQALAVLREVQRPLTAAEILSRIHVRFARDLTREGLAPQLSRLRRDGHLEHRGTEYALPADLAASKDQPR
ncbi:hypothetical protein HNR00_003525 [Methylorubrum rhodinum]|uniref:HTH HARE-type domain-containing protein n=1 Tax=Methylorubrum rhodinum TaxID=29428 RepID=A0A840ZP23_9HYPH|nr:hypothetical protein [Methylorubrum rhodinum]MBB5758798.1 hypothetical protein [Methylorubrum rhodinum]